MQKIEFFTQAVDLGTRTIALLNKGIELLKAGESKVGDKAAIALGYGLESDEYLIAAEATYVTFMLGGMEGKNLMETDAKVEAFERAIANIQKNVTLAQTELEKLRGETAGDFADEPTPVTETEPVPESEVGGEG